MGSEMCIRDRHLISTDSDHKDLVVFTPEGEPINDAPVPHGIYVAGHFHDYIYGPVHIAQVILHRVNLCTITAPTR